MPVLLTAGRDNNRNCHIESMIPGTPVMVVTSAVMLVAFSAVMTPTMKSSALPASMGIIW